MARVAFEDVTKVYPGAVVAVQGLSLEAADGEFLILVGPSGCGKTTALRMVAGLERISDGTIRIGERVVNDVPPKDRDIAMVFQNYALYPHMTVERNLAFGLRQRRTSREDVRRRVDEVSRMLGLATFQGAHQTTWHLLAAANIMSMLPILALFLVAQRSFVRGIATQGLKG